MHSIFHFFRSLVLAKSQFAAIQKLEDFPFDDSLLSCKCAGQFPDLAIKISKLGELFSGGELIELKDSGSYAVSSFNSTIPTGKKEISKVVKGKNSGILRQMENAGDDVFSLPGREVFYLVRDRDKKKAAQKIALVHGSFFETVKIKDLISQAFSQVLQERLLESGLTLTPEVKELLAGMFSEQGSFSKVRTVEKASVKLRFRIQTEVKAEGNVLNKEKYPEILDNSINFVLPCHDETDLNATRQRMKAVFSGHEMAGFQEFKLKHHFNGWFVVFQAKL